MLVSNYRGISLLDTGYKVFTSLLLERINPYATEIVGEYQCGFRKGKSTVDHIHTIRQLAEEHYEYNKDLHLVFIDFKQAYDSINRKQLWKVLRCLDIPQKYIDLIKMCNSKINLKIKYQQEMSEKFEVKSGLRQGDALSPMLFNIALEWVVRIANETRKMEVGEIETILAYADDVVILGNSRNEVKQTTVKFLKAGKIMGLEVNQEKTKYMYISRNDKSGLNLKVDPYIFEKVEVFKYLGININSKNNVLEEIKEWVANANRCYYNLLKLFRSKLLSRESKVILYTSYLRPVLTYGCETWATPKEYYNETSKLLIELATRKSEIEKNSVWNIENSLKTDSPEILTDAQYLQSSASSVTPCCTAEQSESPIKLKLRRLIKQTSYKEKRSKNPEQWKKTKAKLLKNSGKSYTSRTGKTVNERVMGPNCSDRCILKCSSKLSDENRIELFNKYWSLASLQRQRDYLASCIEPLQLKYRRIFTSETPRRQNCGFYLLFEGNRIRVSEIIKDHTICYFWHEGVGQKGAIEIGSCLLMFIEEIASSRPGSDIIFYSDNCCGQQRNRFVKGSEVYFYKNSYKDITREAQMKKAGTRRSGAKDIGSIKTKLAYNSKIPIAENKKKDI
ncbi:hypothetical protein QTP88_019741 [Uroleucon formosanum]